MKEILEGCSKNIKNSEMVTLLEECGFKNIAGVSGTQRFGEKQYLIITKTKIFQYLEQLLLKKGCVKRSLYYFSGREEDYGELSIYGRLSFKYLFMEYRATWKEHPIEDYRSIPPLFVLQEIKRQKELNHFDELRIATVSVEEVKQSDPFLIGLIKGNPARFFICQWGDDINIDNLI